MVVKRTAAKASKNALSNYKYTLKKQAVQSSANLSKKAIKSSGDMAKNYMKNYTRELYNKNLSPRARLRETGSGQDYLKIYDLVRDETSSYKAWKKKNEKIANKPYNPEAKRQSRAKSTLPYQPNQRKKYTRTKPLPAHMRKKVEVDESKFDIQALIDKSQKSIKSYERYVPTSDGWQLKDFRPEWQQQGFQSENDFDRHQDEQDYLAIVKEEERQEAKEKEKESEKKKESEEKTSPGIFSSSTSTSDKTYNEELDKTEDEEVDEEFGLASAWLDSIHYIGDNFEGEMTIYFQSPTFGPVVVNATLEEFEDFKRAESPGRHYLNTYSYRG